MVRPTHLSSSRPDPRSGWNNAPPLPPTAVEPAPAPRGEIAHGGRTIHRASVDGARTPTTEPVSERVEIGGPKGPEPTRYNDWEQKGRCSDF